MDGFSASLALAGLFNVVVEDFRYVQIARNFGTSYPTALLRLTNAELRFTRWGKSVGLNDDVADDQLDGGLWSDNTNQARDNMQQIQRLFGDARRTSKQLERQDDGFGRDQLFEPATDEEKKASGLRDKMCNLSLKRRPKKVMAKAKWALFTKDTFEGVIDDINHLLKDLEDLFPGAKETQLQLAVEEVERLTAGAVEQILGRLAERDEARDKRLEDALNGFSAPMAASTSDNVNQTNNFSGTNNDSIVSANIRELNWNAPKR